MTTSRDWPRRVEPPRDPWVFARTPTAHPARCACWPCQRPIGGVVDAPEYLLDPKE